MTRIKHFILLIDSYLKRKNMKLIKSIKISIYFLLCFFSLSYAQVDSPPIWMRGSGSGPISQLTFINNGNLLVSRSSFVTTVVVGVIRVHEYSSGKLLQTIRYVGFSSAVSHNGELLATEEYHNDHYWYDIHIWNLKQGVELRKFVAPSSVNQIVFSSDDKTIATCHDKGYVCIWDVNTGKLLKTYKGFKGDVREVLFSPDDSLIIAKGGSGRECGIKIWDTKTGELKLSIPTYSTDASVIAVSPNGSFLAYTESIDSIALLDFHTKKMLAKYSTKGKFPETLNFSPDSKLLLLGSDGIHDRYTGDDYENTLLLWKTNDTSFQMELTGHLADVKSSSFTPDGNSIICGLDDGCIPLWDARTGALLKKDVNQTSYINAAAFSSDAKSIITFDDQGIISKWCTKDGNALSSIQYKGEQGSVAAILVKKNLIAVNKPYEGIINLISASTGKFIKSIYLNGNKGKEVSENEKESPTEEIDIGYIAFSNSGKYLLVSSQDKIYILEINSGKCLMKYNIVSSPSCLVFSPDEKQFAASIQSTSNILIWNINSSKPPTKLSIIGHKSFYNQMSSIYGYPRNLKFSKDGNYLSATYDYGPAIVWDIAKNNIIHVFKSESSSLVYSNEGKYLFTSDTRGNVYLWDTIQFSLITKYSTPFNAKYNMLQLSANKKYLLGHTDDGTISVWQIPKNILN